MREWHFLFSYMRYGDRRATWVGMEMFASLFLVAAQLLFQTGVQDAESGKLESARLTLQTLVNTYPQDPLAPSAKAELEVIKLYQEGERLAGEGRFDTAEFTFHTLISVYPESPLAKQAEAAMQAAARAQQELNVRLTVRALDLSGLGLSDRATQASSTDHEVRLAAGKSLRPARRRAGSPGLDRVPQGQGPHRSPHGRCARSGRSPDPRRLAILSFFITDSPIDAQFRSNPRACTVPSMLRIGKKDKISRFGQPAELVKPPLDS